MIGCDCTSDQLRRHAALDPVKTEEDDDAREEEGLDGDKDVTKMMIIMIPKAPVI